MPPSKDRPPRIPRDLVPFHAEGEEVDEIRVALDGGALQGLRYLRLRESVLRDVDLEGLECRRVLFSDVRLERCNLSLAQMETAGLDRVEMVDCRLTGMQVPEARLVDVAFRRCSGHLALFRFARLQRVRFEECQLREADFLECSFEQVRFEDCDLREARMDGARLAGADLRGSQLDGLKARPEDLRGTVLDEVQLVGFARDLARILEIRVE